MVINTFAELTWVLMRHIPIAYESHLKGELVSTTSWKGSTPFFFFSENHKEEDGIVTYIDDPAIYDSTWKMQGVFPDFKKFYKDIIDTDYTRPVIVINNKYINEWNTSPVNYIDVDVLDMIIGYLYDSYEIVYIRSRTNEVGYWNDNQPSQPFNDYKMIYKNYPNVRCLSDMLPTSGIEYNDLQLRLHSIADRYISVAGGNAVVSSCFGGTNLIYRNKKSPRSNDRPIWQGNSHLSQLSGATILGVNCYSDLVDEIKSWV